MPDKFRIAFVGLYAEHNFGDPIIAKCTETMFLENLPESISPAVVRLNIDERHRHPAVEMKLIRKFLRFPLNRIDFLKRFEEVCYVKSYHRYYAAQLQDIDLVVVVGGGIIKYSYQFFWGSLAALFDVAQNLQIPVVLNAVGVEGYDESNWKCRLLQEALYHPTLRYISTVVILSVSICYKLPSSRRPMLPSEERRAA